MVFLMTKTTARTSLEILRPTAASANWDPFGGKARLRPPPITTWQPTTNSTIIDVGSPRQAL